MIRNHLTIALRNLRKQRSYTFINVVGLAIGMVCCGFIALFVLDELSYDRFHDHADRIVRVTLDLRFGEQATHTATTPAPLADALVHDVPTVELATRLWRDPSGDMTVRYQDQAFPEDRVFFADANVFEVFSFPLLRGDPATALRDPYTIVVTESTARKYFGDADPLGKTLVLREPSDRDLFDYQVTGVVADPPAQSHIQFDFLSALTTQRFSRSDNWLDTGVYTYGLLREGADVAALERALSELVATYAGPQMRERLGMSASEFQTAGNRFQLALQPLTRIHLHSDLADELAPNGDARYVYFFSAVALFVLLLACVNFVNLATARAAGRSLEVGVRKALGSGRGQLVRQFLTESVLLSGLALVLALLLGEALLPVLSDVAGRNLARALPAPLVVVPLLLGFALGVGLVAGFYPAVVLSSFRPAAVLKTGGSPGFNPSRLRDGLVVFQFAVSIVLIAGTAVVYSQMRYVQAKKLGFAPEQVVVLEGAEVIGPQRDAFLNAMQSLPGVAHVTNSELVPGRPFDGSLFRVEGRDDLVRLDYTYASFGFVETLGLEVLEGRSLSRQFASDSLAVLLNEAAVQRLGLDDPIGKRLVWPNESTYTIVGVVRDFHVASLRNTIGPVALLGPDPRNTNRPNLLVSARLRAGDLPGTLAAIEATWNRFAPDQPFTYTFLDQDFAALYRNERRTARLFGGFAVVALLIACFGLFGLAAFTAEQRTKEIGIRKVLGASVASIVALLSKRFLHLVGLAFVVAVPVAYLVTSRWLDDFAYRIDISWTIFLMAGLTALVIALITVGYHAVKAALADPVKSLRYE